jgi:hydrogenase expression/formation protein HypC
MQEQRAVSLKKAHRYSPGPRCGNAAGVERVVALAQRARSRQPWCAPLVRTNESGVGYVQAAAAATTLWSLAMCLGIPGQVIELVDRDAGLAKVDISGVRREVSVALVDEPAAPLEVGDWVLIHVGFALARIDEEDARETLALLERGAELQRELDELRAGTVR